MGKPTIEELERDVEEKRRDYLDILAALKSAIGDFGIDSGPMPGDPTFTLVRIESNRLSVERPKLAYEEAVGRLQRAQESEAQSGAEAMQKGMLTSQQSIEGMQKSMTRATWLIAAFTALAAFGAIAAAVGTFTSH